MYVRAGDTARKSIEDYDERSKGLALNALARLEILMVVYTEDRNTFLQSIRWLQNSQGVQSPKGNSVFCLFPVSVSLGSSHLFRNVPLRYGLPLEMGVN